MNIDATLCIKPRPTRFAIVKTRTVVATIARIVGVEHIIDLATQSEVGLVCFERNLVLQIEVCGGVRVQNRRLVLGVVKVLFAHKMSLHRAIKMLKVEVEV